MPGPAAPGAADDDDDLIFDMDDDIAGGDAVAAASAFPPAGECHARCSSCRANFEVGPEHKMLARRRRGRRAKGLCGACRAPCSDDDEQSDDDDNRESATAELAAREVRAAAQKGTELDADTLNAILVRLVSTGTAEQLSLCACVSRTWYAGALNDELWEILFVRRWSPMAIQEAQTLAEDANEARMSHRAQYIRSVTTQVLVWGQGAWQQEPVVQRAPMLVELSGVKAVCAGAGFSCAVTWGGRVYCWGNNDNGQCGIPPSMASNVAQPLCVELPHELFVLQVSCGAEHVGCISHCGTLLCWGSNADDQLGSPLTLNDDECLVIAPSVTRVPATAVPTMRHTLNAGGAYVQVACGAAHTVALASHGAVFAW